MAVLPPLLLSQRVAPELAAGVRNPDERDPPPLRWKALAAALDPNDMLPGINHVHLSTFFFQLAVQPREVVVCLTGLTCGASAKTKASRQGY